MSFAPPRLRTALKRYPHTAALIDATLTDPRVMLDCEAIEPIHRAFAPMARRQAFDVSEMAIVTCLQALAYGKSLVLLPCVVAARLQQKCLVYDSRHGELGIERLRGARVGVRAYTQTTGMWVRAILQGTYGIAPEEIRWVTFEEGHVEEYEEPSFVTRIPKGASMRGMLEQGELDAAIFGNDLPQEKWVAPVIRNPAEADAAWFAAHRFVPINHLVVVKRDVAVAHPEAVAAVYDLLRRGKQVAAADDPELSMRLPDGIEALRRPLEAALEACMAQQLLPRPLTVDTLFEEAARVLGAVT